MENIKVIYQGKGDDKELFTFLEQINEIVKEKNMPTNLYIHTYSPLDMAVIDFHEFILEISNDVETDLSIVVIKNNKGKIINHLIIKPNAILSGEFSIRLTAGSNPYDYLALSLEVE